MPVTSATPTASPRPTTTDASSRAHVVRAGDTLWSLARAYGTDVDALRARNPQLASIPDTALPIGMQLDVGAAPTTPTTTASTTTTAATAAAPPPATAPGTTTASTAAPAPRSPADATTVQQSRQAAQAAEAAARGRVALPGTKLEALVQRGQTLRPGAKGAEVVDLQRFLGMKSSEQDGDFGPRTESALRAFQRQAGVPADGVVGAATLTALKTAGSASAEAQDLALRVQTGNPIVQGESGPYVRGLQRLLGMGPAGQTGTFGPTTRAAVEDAQRRLLGMTPASPGWGGVGPLTYRALTEGASSSGATGPAGQLRVLAQRDATSCGLTSVAMVTNAWNKALGTGAAPITDRTLRAENPGGADLRAAMSRHLPAGVTHFDRDWPRGARSFGDIDAQLAKGNPVIVGLGRPFTASGYGHIFVLSKKNADGSYEMLDPNGGVRKNVSRSALETAGEHREGSFYMVAERR